MLGLRAMAGRIITPENPSSMTSVDAETILDNPEAVVARWPTVNTVKRGAVHEENVLGFKPPFDISDLFEDFQCKTPVQFCSNSTQDRADSLSHPTLVADNFPKIILADVQLENCDRFALNRADLDLVRIVYKSLHNRFD